MLQVETLVAPIRKIVWDIWDPIGVRGIPEAATEYDTYILQLAGFVQRGSSTDEIFEYLRQVETEFMGLSGDIAKTREAAELLAGV